MIMAATWSFFLCFFILAEIVFRAFSLPFSGAKEIVANSVVIIVFLQIGFAIRSGSMLQADFLVAMFNSKVQRVLTVFGYLLGAFFFFFIMQAGYEKAIRSFVRGEFDGAGALQVPIWPSRWMIVLGSGFAGLNYMILALIETFGIDPGPVEGQRRD
jgi:TRAP-type C4-dicarboxylate transport system permease small subunit